ncbi:MBL fold hydrolase [Aliidiomarina minuta]|uniref:MBL fold hydrolase n=1 Tax=Aliidiomarina minuta TaxID=880057 RepID=A0A432W861_9GAMM|nr:MBL fold metallo-hydrolase [Aliidiomarina minuta]RUO26300.1 MBL fold hydrolase [Aliidiomarina minuta]
MQIIHHGAREGVTGSCHELQLPEGRSLLIDCGLFQGAETSGQGADAEHQDIEFDIQHIHGLIITHCHIDHVGRLPWLLMAGFRGPIYCTQATALLLPLVIEDALKVGITRNSSLINAVNNLIASQLRPVNYDYWEDFESLPVKIRFRQAGHILGSAYVEIEDENAYRVVFSGDLGCKNTPLLPDPTPLERADILVLESTYGNRNHENRQTRQQRLQAVIEHAVQDGGAVLIPAFSIGRTQELLYELEDIMHQVRERSEGVWRDIQVILDSPMAAQFTTQYRAMKALWDDEAHARLAENRHPLNFSRLHTIDSHQDHEALVEFLRESGSPCIVIAASGMCTGGRMANYLKALLPDARTDVLFVGYQAERTPGRDIQRYGPRGGYVDMDGQRIWIKAQVYTLGGYSAHADQTELLDFIDADEPVKRVRLVHGDMPAKQALAEAIQQRFAIEAEIAS